MNEKFIKLMMMTTSSSDGEALTVIRKANQFLSAQDVNWEQLIRGLKNVTITVQPADHKPKKAKEKDSPIPEMFDAVLKTLKPDGPRAFIEAIKAFYEDTGFLTEKQYAVLEKFYGFAKTRRV